MRLAATPLAVLLVLSSATSLGQAILPARVEKAVLPARVEQAARERVEAGTYPTLVIAVMQGKAATVRTFGMLDDGNAPDGDTVYEIGSITKTFTATLLAQAVQSGQLALQTPLDKVLPDFKIPQREGKVITLGLIGSQYSGLPRMPTNFNPADPANPYADYDGKQLKAFLADYELPRNPGASFEYSNLGFGLLGYALARTAHTGYGALVEQQILRPLGMTMSGTAFSEAMRAHAAVGHDEAGRPVKNWDFDAVAGAGALRSTANDMVRYLKANMGADAGSLYEAMKLAQTPRLNVNEHNRIGLAWMTTDKGITWHNGGTAGYRSFIGWSADRQHGVVVLSNSSNEVDELGFAVLDEGAPLEPARKVVTLPHETLEAYAGTYALTAQFLLKVTRNGDQLRAQATGQGPLPIYASGVDEFFAKMSGISITFKRDGRGHVTGLVLHQNGDHPAPKVDAADLPPEPKAISLDAQTLQTYVGKYAFAHGTALDVTLHEGQLQARLGPQQSFPVYPSAMDKFFYKVVDAQLEFERDAQGHIVAVILHQNGRDQRAPLIKP